MRLLVDFVMGLMILTVIFALGLRLGLNAFVNLNVLLWRSLAPLRRRQTHLQFQRLPLMDYILGIGSLYLIVTMLTLNLGTHCPPERNSGVQANVYSVHLGIEAYAADHEGRYPASLRDLAPHYLKTLPRTPWGTQQDYAAEIPATIQEPGSWPRGALGLGSKVDPRLPTDFGAIGYSRIGADGRHYRLSGTGKFGDQAIIVAYQTNLPEPPPSPRSHASVIGASEISGTTPSR